MVSILTDDPADRNPLRRALADAGIETRPAFVPIHEMPMYGPGDQAFPVARSLSERGINLPSYPALTEADIDQIAGACTSFFANAKRPRA